MIISIVIPFHNEEQNLKILIPSLFDVINELSIKFEILLVDDVSTDNSASIVESYERKFPQIKLLKLDKRGGQTGCYETAFAYASGDFIIRMDADLQDDPRDLPLFIEKIQNGSQLIMGLRECRKHLRILRIASGIYDLIILTLFNSPLHSNAGSFVAFKTSLVKNIPFHKNDHRYLPLIAMRRGAENISEVFVRHNERQFGKSKYNPFLKLILGIPEVFIFLWRYIHGTYDY